MMWAYLYANGGSDGTSISTAKTPVDMVGTQAKKGDYYQQNDWITAKIPHKNTTRYPRTWGIFPRTLWILQS